VMGHYLSLKHVFYDHWDIFHSSGIIETTASLKMVLIISGKTLLRGERVYFLQQKN
jgi:hypothetical protein